MTEKEGERECMHGETVVGGTEKETAVRVREKSTTKNRDKTRRTSEQETDDGTEWRYTGREKSGSVPWTTALAYRDSLRSPSFSDSNWTSQSSTKSRYDKC